MTLPTSFPMSMSQIATELGLLLPLSINHAWVIALAGKSGLPVSFSDLLGQTAQPTWSGTPSGDGTVMTMSVPFFRGTASSVNAPINILNPISVTFSVSPNWNGNIKITNNSTGSNTVLTKANSTTWSGNGVIMRGGITDNYKLSPSN